MDKKIHRWTIRFDYRNIHLVFSVCWNTLLLSAIENMADFKIQIFLLYGGV